jgi:hypothetical protein
MATPRRGCVEVRKLRLRIHVLNSSSSSSKDKQSHTTTMVRRRDTILLSKGDFGAVVLKFDNVSSCMAFVDRMVELNQDHVFNQNEEKRVQVRQLQRKSSLVGTSFGGSGTYCAGGQSHIRTGMDMDADLHTGDANRYADADLCADADTNSESAIQSHMMNLLHDDDFLGFVDRVESSLASNQDCRNVLQALAYPRADREWSTSAA